MYCFEKFDIISKLTDEIFVRAEKSMEQELALQLKNVYFSYDSADEKKEFALCGVDLAVKKGEFLAILGHNGSGKSTLARLCDGLLMPDSGSVCVLGKEVKDDKNVYEVRRHVGIVFQNPDNQTVASIVEDDVAFGPENVGLPREEIKKRIDFALSAVGMESYRGATPARLSGGQKQRVAIAGVLALKPEIMIMDESTAMLDPKGRREVIEVVDRLNKEEGITVVLITHFPEEALLADRAIVMNRGEIVMEGKPEDVLKSGEKLEEYSLTLPRPLKMCRTLSSHGFPVRETLDAEKLAAEISKVLPSGEYGKKSKAKNYATDGNENGQGKIDCSLLSYTYNPSSPFETHALRDACVQVESGEFFGVIGHTGSGKSTFVQHLNALIKLPTAEKKFKKKKGKEYPTRLTVDGFDLTDKKTDFKALRSKVGMVFQYPEYQLFAETVYQDVAFGLKNFSEKPLSEDEITSAVKEAIETVGLSYEEVKDKSPFELSGGQRRRVAIAGVIVTKPEILVLDEPAAGLDPLGKEQIMQLLHKIHKDWCKTVIFVSHDMDEISENCTRAAVFSEGKVLWEETPEELFSHVDELFSLGLDVPFVAKITKALKKYGITIHSDLTEKGFIAALLSAKGVQ